MRVSRDPIYRPLFVHARGCLRKEFTACWRRRRTRRHPLRLENLGGSLLDRIMISQRPAESEDRAVPGRWEGDLLIGKNGKSAIGILVERHSRFDMLLQLPRGTTAPSVRCALVKKIGSLPSHLRRSIT